MVNLIYFRSYINIMLEIPTRNKKKVLFIPCLWQNHRKGETKPPTYRFFAEAAEFVLAGGTMHGHREQGCPVSGRATCASVSGCLLLRTVALWRRWRLIHLANGAGLARLRRSAHRADGFATSSWTPGARLVQFDFLNMRKGIKLIKINHIFLWKSLEKPTSIQAIAMVLLQQIRCG